MPKPYSEDLRERVIEAVECGASRREAAENFRLSPEFGGEMVAALARYWKRQSEAERREQVTIGGARGMAAEAGRRAAGFDAGPDRGRDA
jgi:transposase